MNETLETISTFSVSFPAILGCFRYKRIGSIYRPFLWVIGLSFINEVLNFFIIRAGYSNSINSNIYALVESVLIILFFRRLGLFDRWPPLFYVMLAMFVVVWIANNFIIGNINQFSSYFIIVASFSYVLMSISVINRLIVSQVKTLIRNSLFLIMMGFVIFYTFAVLAEICWVYGLTFSKEFERNVYRIMTFINIVVNLIYAFAVLWIPKKRISILL